MIGVDTNVLVRYYVGAAQGVDDTETLAQCEKARLLLDGGKRLLVSKTVILELEWVLRGHYGQAKVDIQRALTHLLGLSQVAIEDKVAVQAAVRLLSDGFDFADALHHASYRTCTAVVTFDDKSFARRAKRVGTKPAVMLL